jgi:uncharacterized protein YkwD
MEVNMKISLVAWFILTTGLAATGSEVITVSHRPTVDYQLLVIEHNVISKTNAERNRYGLPPRSIDPSLVESARQHAAWMARFQTMRHTGATIAENIAMGQNSSTEVLQSWMNSSGHRANILNGQYRRIGAAAYRGRDGRIYWCQQFLY